MCLTIHSCNKTFINQPWGKMRGADLPSQANVKAMATSVGTNTCRRVYVCMTRLLQTRHARARLGECEMQGSGVFSGALDSNICSDLFTHRYSVSRSHPSSLQIGCKEYAGSSFLSRKNHR